MLKKIIYLLFFVVGAIVVVPSSISYGSELDSNVGLVFTEHPKNLLIKQVESVISPEEINQKQDCFKLKVSFDLSNQESPNEKIKNKVKALFNSEAHELTIELGYQSAAGEYIQLEAQKKNFDYTTEGQFSNLFEVGFNQLSKLESAKDAAVVFVIRISDDSESIIYLNQEIQQKVYFPTKEQQEMHIYQQSSANEVIYRHRFNDNEMQVLKLKDGVSFPESFPDEITKNQWLASALSQGNEQGIINNKAKIGAEYSAKYTEADGLIEKQSYLYEYTRLFYSLMSLEATSGYGFAPQLTLLYTTDKLDDDLSEKQILTLKAQILVQDDSDFEQVQLVDAKDSEQFTTKEKLKEEAEEGLLAVTPFDRYSLKSLNLPEVKVEKYSGSILTEDAAHRSIPGVVKGGGKLYFKFWPETIQREQALSYQLNAVGINQRTITLGTSYKIVGYMYNHLNSDSTSQDKFLLSPYNENSNLLSGWSSAERKWLKSK